MDMNNLLDSLPDNTVLLSNGQRELGRAALAHRVEAVKAALRARRVPDGAVAILADNDPEWLVADLATQALGLTLVPLPLFFTPAQWLHVMRESGAQAIFCADPHQARSLGFDGALDCGGPLGLYQSAQPASAAPLVDVQKIPFTSRTTSPPKGA